jgi:tetratricopeptide (TPR) repeat protein/CHAT domain-containing protein
MPFSNNALVLEILKQGQQLAVSIFEKEEIASTIKHYSQLSLPWIEINELCKEVTSILNRADENGNLRTDLMNNLKKTSQLLWDQLLTRGVKERLKTTKILDLVLSIDEELINIPWELLFDGKDFLCLKFNVGRLIRTKGKLNPPHYRSLPVKLKMLILANPTNDLKSAYLEGVHTKNQFDKRRNEISIDFKSTNIDTLYVKRNLRDYDIVHFAGHCEYDPGDPRSSGWVLSDGKFSVMDILSLGESLSLPSLVFSNACHSAEAASDFLDMDYQARAYSLASAFLFSGVRHYIGTIQKIEDPVSLIFATEFYTHLISGKSVGECIRLGRLRLVNEYGIGAISWANYLLYGDPNFILFRPKSKIEKERIRKSFILYKKYIRKSVFVLAAIAVVIVLYFWLPTINPSVYVSFLNCRSLFLRGKNQEVIFKSNRIIQKDPKYLPVYSLLGDTYQRLGNKEMALKYYFDYMLYSEKRNDKNNLAKAYIGIGWIYHGQGLYPKALDFYNKALALSRENNDKLNEAAALRKIAVWFIDKQNYDKALELLLRSSEINRTKPKRYEHGYNLACDYFDIGLVFVNKEDFKTAREFYEKSRQIFEKIRLKDELSDYYFNLGEICLFEKQYQKALDYYFKGLKIDQAENNLPSIASDYNMIGELYFDMDNLAEAERFFKMSLEICKRIDAPLELACAYHDLGVLYKKKGQKNKTREYLRQAQEIYVRIDTPDYQDIKEELLSLD